MRMAAIGKREMIIGFMLAGIKERFETNAPEDALKFLDRLEKEEAACLIVIASDIFKEIKAEILEIQSRKPSFVFYEFLGGAFSWREES